MGDIPDNSTNVHRSPSRRKRWFLIAFAGLGAVGAFLSGVIPVAPLPVAMVFLALAAIATIRVTRTATTDQPPDDQSSAEEFFDSRQSLLNFGDRTHPESPLHYYDTSGRGSSFLFGDRSSPFD